jgi:AMP phosphorylase
MKLKSKFLGLETGGKSVVIINKEDAGEIGIRSLGRVRLQFGKKELTAIVNISTRFISRNFIGVSEEVSEKLGLKDGDELEVEIASFPISLNSIINKLKGRKLNYEEILQIVKDVVDGNLSEIEIAAFVTALNTYTLDLDEAASLATAMYETGDKLKISKKTIFDKHSVGGVPGDKTTLLVVPIVAAAGLTIPKTSSRAVTSAAGTADRAETLMKVDLDIDEMRTVVEMTGGCFVWGGALRLAPADDIFIQVEYPLGIDPLLLSSIMAKKKAVGANFLVVDIPTGRGTKIKTIGDANLLAKDFLEMGKKLGITTKCAITFGEQPVGHTLGPALEAREALETIMKKKNVYDLIDKAAHIAGMILEMGGKKDGEKLAREILKSGKAEEKFREIIGHQQGDVEVKPEDIHIGDYGFDYHAERSGTVLWINNQSLVEIAKMAGCPKDKGAGVYLYKKMGDSTKKGEKLFTVYAEKNIKLARAQKIIEENDIMGVGERMEMLIKEIEESKVPKKLFNIIDR